MDIIDLGIAKYEDVLEVQNDLVSKRLRGEIPDTLILVEHFPVVTLGRLAEERSLVEADYFKKRNIQVVKTNRGGKITYHAPGQLVMYPVIDLRKKKKDISGYIDFLERTVANSLNLLGIPAERGGERRGVWLGGKKIAFIGIAAKRWVTFHGVSVNINNDIEPFSRMHPCGEEDIKVTSAKEIRRRDFDMPEVKNVFKDQFTIDLEKEYAEWNCACPNFQKEPARQQ